MTSKCHVRPRLDPRLGGNDYKKHCWHLWGNLNMNFRLKYYIKREVTQLCLTLRDPKDCSHFPGKSTGVGCHFLLQGISWPRDRTPVSHTAGRCFTIWAIREAQLWLRQSYSLWFWSLLHDYIKEVPAFRKHMLENGDRVIISARCFQMVKK